MNVVYWDYNPLTNHLLTSWDVLVGGNQNGDNEHNSNSDGIITTIVMT